MSEDWGADHIPMPRGTRPSGQDLVAALADAQDMPFDAIEDALQRPAAIADAVLDTLGRAAGGEELDARGRNLLFWGVHVLAQSRDERVAAPLLNLLRRSEEHSLVLVAEILAGALPKIIASTFDDDIDALETAITDRDADEFARWTMFGAYAFLVFDGRIPTERAHALLVRFDDDRLARAGDAAWSGWEDAVGLLGFTDLLDRREAALADARLLGSPDGEDGFAALLAMAADAPDDPERFDAHALGYLDDAIGELDNSLASDEDEEPGETIHNPFRHVGRNDPCPCGSGRKFKKCCLDSSAA